MSIEKQYIKQLNDSTRANVSPIKLESAQMDEAQRDGSRVNFDTLGGSVKVSTSFTEDPEYAKVGFNSSSRGDINFIGPAEDRKALDALEDKVLDFIEKAVSEYDEKVTKFMTDLGFRKAN